MELNETKNLWCSILNMFCSDTYDEYKDDIDCDGDCKNCPYSEEV